jgi:hypothetical protein
MDKEDLGRGTCRDGDAGQKNRIEEGADDLYSSCPIFNPVIIIDSIHRFLFRTTLSF